MPSDIDRAGRAPLIVLSGALVAYAHAICALLAFFGALVVGLSLHYEKIVKNGIARWPDEWWPSVSATIGDWAEERSAFQIGIAVTSGPRFALVLLSSLLVSLSHPGSARSRILPIVGILRTFAAGGFVYITSSDNHDLHDISMIAYLVCTPFWMYIASGSLVSSGSEAPDPIVLKARTMRRRGAIGFWSMIPPMVFFFYRHKVLEIPGAYSIYSIFEWGLIVFDVLFDSAAIYDLSRLEIHIVEAARPAAAVTDASARKLVSGAWVEGGTELARRSGAWSTPSAGGDKGGKPVKSDGKTFKGHLESAVPSIARDAALFAAECYYGFISWTTLTALHPSIFFFSVNNMGIAGHEALLIVQVFGLAFALLPPLSSRLRASTTASLSQDVLRVVSLSAVACWWHRPFSHRLLLVALGNAAFAILQALEWGAAIRQGSLLDRKIIAWLIGLLLSSLAKYANHSNNPIWPFMDQTNGGKNVPGLILAVTSIALIKALSPRELAPQTLAKGRGGPSFGVAALSLGALLYSLHGYLTDSGTMIAWTWTGYPVKGPMAVPHGFLVIATSAISIGITAFKGSSFGSSPVLLVVLALSNAALLHLNNWTGFIGALGIAFALPAVTLPIIRGAFQRHDALKIALASWLVADLLTFFQVLTVAYAFVPGGKPFRERTSIMQVVYVSLLALGLFKSVPSEPAATGKLGARTRRLRTLCAPALLGLSTLAASVPFFRVVASARIKPSIGSQRLLTAGIWTIHFALDQHMYDSSRRMSSLLKDLDMDVMGFLETDLHRSVFGNRDMTQWLADELGMYADIGPGPDKHTWGAALLSKFPILRSEHHLLPSPDGELAPAISAMLDVYGTPVHVIVSHNGQEEDPVDRFLQTTEIARLLNSTYPQPALFLGYVVTHPHAERPAPYKILFEDGRINDIEPSDSDRWCQYMGWRGLVKLAFARVSRYTVSDTELQTMRLLVPMPGSAAAASLAFSPDGGGGESQQPQGNGAYEEVEAERIPEVWRYTEKFVDPDAMVYDRHKYSPWPYRPRYYLPRTHQYGSSS